MSRASAARLVLLAAIWGASFLLVSIAAPVIGPLATADLRMLIGGGALAAYCGSAVRSCCAARIAA